MDELKKVVKKYGDTLIISFTKEECKIHKIKEGDILQVQLNNSGGKK